MKKYVLLVIALTTVLVAFTGCKKETSVASEPESQSVKVPMTFSASINAGPGLRTELDGETHKITVWSEGDKIKIATEQTFRGEANEFTLTDGAGTPYGTFTGECEKGELYLAAYPASLLLEKFIYSLPGTQKYVENGFAPNTVPLFSYSETKELNFINVTGMLRLGVKLKSGSDNIVVKSMILKDNQTYKKLWGLYTYNRTLDGIEYLKDGGGDNTMTIDLGNGVELNSNSFTYFYFCLPTETLLEGFTVEMEDADGKVATIDYTGTDKAMEQGKGKTYEAAGVEFKIPTTGYAEVSSSAGITDGKVMWVQLWEGGPKWAVYNVGATSVGEYGGYYYWGMAIDRDPEGRYYEGEGNIQGGDHDTAKNLWGKNWQMPTDNDLTDLYDKCNVEWTSDYKGTGKAGNVFTGTGNYSGNSVFFPIAGFYAGEVVYDEVGYYWSSISYEVDGAERMYFNEWNHEISGYDCTEGYLVRAILAE